MLMNGQMGQYIEVIYSDEKGRVMSGDVVSVHGTIKEDPLHKDIVLVADSIYFPTKEEINAWAQRQVDTIIRPLAKLGKAVKIADTSNQRKAKRETMPAVAIAFRENAKPFDKADSVFNKDTLP